MKPFLSIAVALALLSQTAAAQFPCGISGVTVELSPANPLPGEPVDITLVNNSAEHIDIASTCAVLGPYPNVDCSAPSIFGGLIFCQVMVVGVPVGGGTYTETWDGLDGAGQPVAPGWYSFRVSYVNATTNFVCCVPFMVAPYRSHCRGNGGDQLGCTDCPCGNNAGPGTDGGCLNSLGASAQLHPSGVASVTGDTFRLEVDGATPSTFGVLVSGDNLLPSSPVNPCAGLDSGVTSTAFDGLRCVGGGVLRHGARAADAAGEIGITNAGWGSPDAPAAGLIAQGGFNAGQTRHFQAIYRDDAAAGCNTGQNTTQAVSVTFTP